MSYVVRLEYVFKIFLMQLYLEYSLQMKHNLELSFKKFCVVKHLSN